MKSGIPVGNISASTTALAYLLADESYRPPSAAKNQNANVMGR